MFFQADLLQSSITFLQLRRQLNFRGVLRRLQGLWRKKPVIFESTWQDDMVERTYAKVGVEQLLFPQNDICVPWYSRKDFRVCTNESGHGSQRQKYELWSVDLTSNYHVTQELCARGLRVPFTHCWKGIILRHAEFIVKTLNSPPGKIRTKF